MTRPEDDEKDTEQTGETADSKGAPETSPSRGDDADRIERRAFFSEGLRGLLKPISGAIERRVENVTRAVEHSRRIAEQSSLPTVPQRSYESEPDRLLRPPGALGEELFADRCARSGQCVSACPVNAIQFLESHDPMLSGTPFIDPHVQACVVCEDLACMKVCPSGALQNVPRHLIDIGVAELRVDICVREEGEDCRICVEKCPLGAEAIAIGESSRVEVKDGGCIGCGVCEMYCPTEPRAIVVAES